MSHIVKRIQQRLEFLEKAHSKAFHNKDKIGMIITESKIKLLKEILEED